MPEITEGKENITLVTQNPEILLHARSKTFYENPSSPTLNSIKQWPRAALRKSLTQRHKYQKKKNAEKTSTPHHLEPKEKSAANQINKVLRKFELYRKQ